MLWNICIDLLVNFNFLLLMKMLISIEEMEYSMLIKILVRMIILMNDFELFLMLLMYIVMDFVLFVVIKIQVVMLRNVQLKFGIIVLMVMVLVGCMLLISVVFVSKMQESVNSSISVEVMEVIGFNIFVLLVEIQVEKVNSIILIMVVVIGVIIYLYLRKVYEV